MRDGSLADMRLEFLYASSLKYVYFKELNLVLVSKLLRLLDFDRPYNYLTFFVLILGHMSSNKHKGNFITFLLFSRSDPVTHI